MPIYESSSEFPNKALLFDTRLPIIARAVGVALRGLYGSGTHKIDPKALGKEMGYRDSVIRRNIQELHEKKYVKVLAGNRKFITVHIF